LIWSSGVANMVTRLTQLLFRPLNKLLEQGTWIGWWNRRIVIVVGWRAIGGILEHIGPCR